jgi:hypothetical protein
MIMSLEKRIEPVISIPAERTLVAFAMARESKADQRLPDNRKEISEFTDFRGVEKTFCALEILKT